jgi:hypothetical protein
MSITLATRTATKVLSAPTVVAIFGSQLTALGALTHGTQQATTGLCKTSRLQRRRSARLLTSDFLLQT